MVVLELCYLAGIFWIDSKPDRVNGFKSIVPISTTDSSWVSAAAGTTIGCGDMKTLEVSGGNEVLFPLKSAASSYFPAGMPSILNEPSAASWRVYSWGLDIACWKSSDWNNAIRSACVLACFNCSIILNVEPECKVALAWL